MTRTELSDMFDTLLNSYAVRGLFGESSSGNINLDEYEKSVYLTQAQDIIVKSYFDRTLNPQAQGFDDSTRRQVDFSSLVKVAELTEAQTPKAKICKSVSFDWEDDVQEDYLGTVTITNKMNTALNVNINIYQTVEDYHGYQDGVNVSLNGNTLTIDLVWEDMDNAGVTMSTLSSVILDTSVKIDGNNTSHKAKEYIHFRVINPQDELLPMADNGYDKTLTIAAPQEYDHSKDAFDRRGIIYKMPSNGDVSDVLFILNERLIAGGTEYVVVPINYQEYDREMSKAYAQPLKKQAWRLFQNIDTGFDIYSELIPRFDVDMTDAVYRVRYVRRPKPIVLGNLDGLSLEGEDSDSGCELNPILHMDIVQKAVELVVASRGGRVATNS